MRHLIDGVRHAVKCESWYAALGLALALPGICGWVETPVPSGEGDRRARYSRWFNENLRPLYTRRGDADHEARVLLDGDDCYALRCACSGEGDVEITAQWTHPVLERFQFVIAAGSHSIHKEKLMRSLAQQCGLPAVNLSEIDIDDSVLKLVPREFCEKHQVIPVRHHGATLIVAMVNPANIYAIDLLKTLTMCNVEPVVSSEAGIDAAVSRYYGSSRYPGTRLQIGVPELCADVCAAVETWLRNVVEPAMLERIAGLGRIDFIRPSRF